MCREPSVYEEDRHHECDYDDDDCYDDDNDDPYIAYVNHEAAQMNNQLRLHRG